MSHPGDRTTADSRGATDAAGSPDLRLDSWKEIAAYLKRHVTTVRRWEKSEGLPVHRQAHDKLGSVYAFRAELDEWWRSRRVEMTPDRQRRVDLRLGKVGLGDSQHILSANWHLMVTNAAVTCSIVAIAWTLLVGRAGDGRSPSVSVLPEVGGLVGVPSSVDPAARQEYLIGRYHLWRDNDENLKRAIAHFERAVEIEPRYAAAYASLAHAWWKRGLWSQTLAATESPARAAARQALQIDDTLPDAHVVLADLERLYSRDLVLAEKLVMQALKLDPNHTDAHYTYGLLLMTLGRFTEAITHMETAARFDPLSPAIQSDFGRVLYRARRYEEAIARLNTALHLEPAMGWLVHRRLADAYEQMGRYDQALAALRKASVESGRPYTARFARVLARAGNHGEARRLLKDLEQASSDNDWDVIAGTYVALGDHDAAFKLLIDRLERDNPGPNFVVVDPPFDRLRADPRWEDVLRRVNSPVKWDVTG